MARRAKAAAAAGFEDSEGVCKSLKAQLATFIDYLRTGKRPFPFEETIELMQLVIGGTISREQGAREVYLDELRG